jgi:cell wall-associated NlpC family hydrolase
LSRARVALAALTAPFLCLLAVNTSAQVKAKKPAQPVKNTASRRLSRGEYVARKALTFRGVPYRFGGRSRNGVDCSGLIQTVWQQYGLYLPRTSVAQFKSGIDVPKKDVKQGDLVFFQNTYKRGISHVGIYVGEGKFVHAANKRKGVIMSSLGEVYWTNHWAGARRVSLDKLPAPSGPVQRETYFLLVTEESPSEIE